jgi:hypothetical protein
MLAGVVLSLATSMACSPIAGEASLWANPNTHYVIVGEVHGTSEAPAFFGDLACAAQASGRPVVVALEAAETEQDAVDRFIASDGGAAAREAFLHSAIWTGKLKDGRSSRAYYDLFDRMRVLKASGMIAAVVVTQPARPPAPKSQTETNARMADRFRAARGLYANALVLVLVGNFHASKRPLSNGVETIVPAAADLPPDETISLNVVTGGEAWNCVGSDCKPHELATARPAGRAVRLGAGALPDYDGEIDLGAPATASAPAVP